MHGAGIQLLMSLPVDDTSKHYHACRTLMAGGPQQERIIISLLTQPTGRDIHWWRTDPNNTWLDTTGLGCLLIKITAIYKNNKTCLAWGTMNPTTMNWIRSPSGPDNEWQTPRKSIGILQWVRKKDQLTVVDLMDSILIVDKRAIVNKMNNEISTSLAFGI